MPKNPDTRFLKGAGGLKQPSRDRDAVLGRVAEARRLRDRDASRAMKEHNANRLEVLAKTARLRADRLARLADVTPRPKSIRRKII